MERPWNDGIGQLNERKDIIKERKKDIRREGWKDIIKNTENTKGRKEVKEV